MPPQLLNALWNWDFCLAYLTCWNLDEEWIHFEAGVVALGMDQLKLRIQGVKGKL